MPSPNLTAGIQGVQPPGLGGWPAVAAGRDGLSFEYVEAELGAGRWRVLGFSLPVAGDFTPAVGQRAAVQWVSGRPVAIVEHDFQRGRGRAVRRGFAGVVEELLLGSLDAGPNDVFFRNYSVFAALRVVDAQGNSSTLRSVIGGSPQAVRWGDDGSSFAVRHDGTKVAIFTIVGRSAPNEPLPPGRAPTARLVRDVDVAGSGATLLTLTATRTGSGSRWTVTSRTEEPRKARVTSKGASSVESQSHPEPTTCGTTINETPILTSTSITCISAAQKAALGTFSSICDDANGFKYLLGAVPLPNGGDRSYFVSQEGADALDEYTLGELDQAAGDVSVAVEDNRVVRLTSDYFSDVPLGESTGDFVISINDFVVPRPVAGVYKLVVNLFLKAQFLSANRVGDTSAGSSVQQQYTNDFEDPHWTQLLRPFAGDADENPVPQIQAGFDVQETHSLVVDGDTGAVLWGTLGGPTKTIAAVEEYSWLDDNNAGSLSPFDDDFTGPIMVLPTAALGWAGVEPNRANPTFGVAGGNTLDSSYVTGALVDDLLFIGAGMATEEVARVTAVSGGLVNLDRSLQFTHYQPEVVFRQPGGIYYEQENAGDTCSFNESRVDFCQPGAAEDGAPAISFALAGAQGKSSFKNDLWDPALLGTLAGTDQYVEESSVEACREEFAAGDYVASWPLNWPIPPEITNQDKGFVADWSMPTQRARHVARYRVTQHAILAWDPTSAAATRQAVVVERHDNTTGSNRQTLYVVNGVGTVVDTPAANLVDTDVFIETWTSTHLVWSEDADAGFKVVAYDMVAKVAKVVAPDDPGFEDFDLRGLKPDLLYQTLPVNSEKFVKAWSRSGGSISLDAASVPFPEPDGALAAVGKLALQPQSPKFERFVDSGDVGDRQRDYQLDNSQAILGPLGRFDTP